MQTPPSTQALFEQTPYEREFSASIVGVSGNAIALDQTLFYPIGGGQPGDTGVIHASHEAAFQVIDTVRDSVRKEIIWHVLAEPAHLGPGTSIRAAIDWNRRYRHMRMHTCLHLLCAVVDAPVTGCSIGEERGRLDFDIPASTLDKEQITIALNELVSRGLDVSAMSLPASRYQEALALVHNKIALPPIIHGGIRLVRIGGINTQPCGGTHVRNTAEIGTVICDKIEKKSKHNRRVAVRFAAAES